MRSGTVPHTLAVGFGAACSLAAEEMEASGGGGGIDVVYPLVANLCP